MMNEFGEFIAAIRRIEAIRHRMKVAKMRGEPIVAMEQSDLDEYTATAIEHAAIALLWTASDASEDGNGFPIWEGSYCPYVQQVIDNVPYLTEAVTAFVRDSDNWNNLHLAGVTAEMCGHDFILTANHHGAGFWDRGTGVYGERLTEACRGYSFDSEFELDDDGEVVWLMVENTVIVDEKGYSA